MITREDVENIALLSKLFVPEEEMDNLTQSMQEIVNFADTINNADTEGVEFDNINNLSNVFRQDDVKESLPVEEILSNAPEQAENHFLVRKQA
ncbi:MAG: Asp-tRNA(Asn)/Glu-tRNA(Gln) amidotransferase subunit GatC [Oscillospiraceae bacterium]|nr:Asp-tRNA(Asn)/Glu-tRNA(Gln) amidotransferase subunit GatC [Oscillospiraceae bacterium]